MGLELCALLPRGFDQPLDLDVPRDRITGLVVPDAHLAAALVDAVTGITPPLSGHVEVDGERVPPPAAGIASEIAFVPADGGLLPNLTVQANITYGRRTGAGLQTGQVRPQLNLTAAELNLLDVLDLHPHELTACRRLWVGLARALLRAPAALVLEDRASHPGWSAQLTRRDPLDGVAVLVVADSPDRLTGFADTVEDLSERSR
ncbi:ATP-binding cassette domain-containing protein [Umezawaea beigongshangensis]|uniref:ATP-binding cassette domain-containing protein n=1 Tax=Umezawaea beigongshangensis TaxID=2780383 RepID=UPI0018F1C0E8|nr:ATP-binding cassette domain-containing protein [Umezawaea beigongshangensis]